MSSEWIVRLAEDERRRDDVRSRATTTATRKSDLVRLHGQRLLDELRTTVARDIEEFRGEFPGDPTREIRLETVQADGGFVVLKPQDPTVALRVAPHLPAASIGCEYRFTPINGLPPREDHVEFMFTSGGDDTVLQIRHQGTAQVFTTAEALSEYLLVPVFTGRPR